MSRDAKAPWDDLHGELSELFGRDVLLWHPSQGWVSPLPERTRELRTIDDGVLGDWITCDGAKIDRGVDGLNRLGFRIRVARRHFLVAVVGVEASEKDWPMRAALCFQKAARQRVVGDDIRSQLDASMAQISSDFEQQTYLRFLAEQIEICDVTRNVEHVTRRVLPRLQTVLEAQSVVFVPLASEGEDRERDLLAVGANPFNRSTLVDVIERFEIELVRGPVVKNIGFSAAADHLPAGMQNLVLAPVEKDSTSLGWLLAINRDPSFVPAEAMDNGFGTVEAGLMQVTALMLATHGRNVALFRETESLTVGMVRALVNAIEARDSYTRGHSERVGIYAKLIAQQMKLDEEQCERIYIAGLLHDIGKIGISDDVLRKPGRLTPEEYAEIQQHPDIGWGILQGLKKIEYLLPGVLHHHERIDGLGYPDGIAGENIPLQARILAVADSWDAMTSARPYREAMPSEKAQSILRHGRGSQWDADAIDAFFEILPAVIAVGESYEPRPLEAPRRKTLPDAVSESLTPVAAAACEVN